MLRMLLIPMVLAFGAAILLVTAVATGSAIQASLIHLGPVHLEQSNGAEGGPARFTP